MSAIRVVTVGRTRRGPFLELEDDYLGRIARLAPVRRDSAPQSAARRPEERRAAEAAALTTLVGGRATLVALDSGGRALDSAGFREALLKWRSRGEVAFVVGGPDGLDDSLLSGAAATLSFGPLTMPHEMALVVLLEQIYRALAAEQNHPYSRH